MSEAEAREDLPALIQAGRSPLVGRARALAFLLESLAETRSGRARIVLLAGPAGIGKTRLLDELADRALAAGVTVLRGGSSQAAGMPPYLPFLTALGDYIRAAPAQLLREQAGPQAGVLATLLPELADRLGPLGPRELLGPEQERFRLYEAVAVFLAEIARANPALLLLDDLQWFDAASLDLLLHIAGRTRAVPLLIAGGYRDGELGETPALARALAELNRRRSLVTLPLHPLAAGESVRLAESLLGGPLARRASDWLVQQSEGNPYFLEELVRSLVEDAVLIERAGAWDFRDLPPERLPAAVIETLHLRLERLPAEVLSLLQTAAVIGRRFTSPALARLCGLDLDAVEQRLRVPLRAGLVRRERVPDVFSFTHDLVREALDDDLTQARRQTLHWAIGEALEVEAAGADPTRLPELAFHFLEAGDLTRGVDYALAAGDEALRLSAGAEALRLFRGALRLLEPTTEQERRARALAGVADAALLLGAYAEAAEAYESAQAIALRTGDRETAAELWLQLGKVRWRQEAVDRAALAFQRVLSLLDPSDSRTRAEALLQLADLHATSLGRHAEGLTYAEAALAMVERLGDRRLAATAYCLVGNVRVRSNDLAVGRALLERALQLAQALDDPALVAETCGYLGIVVGTLGELGQSRALGQLRLEMAQRTQDPFQLRHVYASLGLVEVMRGRWAEAERLFGLQEEALRGFQSPEPLASLQLARGILGYFTGRFDEAERLFQAAVELVRPTGSGALIWFLGPLGLALAETGKREESLACFSELRSLADELHEGANARVSAFTHLALGYQRLGRDELAAASYAPLLPFQGQHAPDISVDRALGVAAWSGGDPVAARRHLVAAVARARDRGLRPELALSLIELGLLEGGEQSGPLADGLALASALGMGDLAGRLRERVKERRIGGAVAPAGGKTGRLSSRELEVLRLIARGWTNREVAEELYLSEKTVARHLTNIYNKTGVENRAGAVAFALRHGLA